MSDARSIFLLSIIKKYASKNSTIMELGCNAGRNLNCLYKSGFKNLNGVEINKNAIKLLKQTYPELAKKCRIFSSPIENIIKNFGDSEFDIVFTMAVLEHIHYDSDWVLPHIARVTKKILITIEDENGRSWNYFPRNYETVFKTLGLKQIDKINCKDIDGLGKFYTARIFMKH